MATFAVIKDGVVDNCIVAESLAIAEEITGLTCVEYAIPHIGYAYADGKFSAPEPAVAEEPPAPAPAPQEIAPTGEQENSNG